VVLEGVHYLLVGGNLHLFPLRLFLPPGCSRVGIVVRVVDLPLQPQLLEFEALLVLYLLFSARLYQSLFGTFWVVVCKIGVEVVELVVKVLLMVAETVELR
jgi:hypothetical protein